MHHLQVLGEAGLAAENQVLPAPSRHVVAPEFSVRRGLGPRQQIGKLGQDHAEAMRRRGTEVTRVTVIFPSRARPTTARGAIRKIWNADRRGDGAVRNIRGGGDRRLAPSPFLLRPMLPLCLIVARDSPHVAVLQFGLRGQGLKLYRVADLVALRPLVDQWRFDAVLCDTDGL